MNMIELCFSSRDVPALYDFYLGKNGVFSPMDPEVPMLFEIVQVVAEGDDLTECQRTAIKKYAKHFSARIHKL